MVFSTRSAVSSLNFARVRVMSRCFGPVASAVMNGRLIWLDVMPDSSIFAFSAASFSLCMAILSPERSMPFSCLEGGNHPIHDALIEVVAAQAVVAGGCKHFLHAVAHLDDGDIERTAAEVIHHDLLLVALVDAIGQSRGRRLVDDTLYIQARDLAGVLGRLALCVGEVCRDGDNSGADGFAQIGFCVRLQLLQDHCGNLLRGVALIVNRSLYNWSPSLS